MGEVSLSTLSEKVLPAASDLLLASCCPTRDLVALSVKGPAPSLQLSRTTSKADTVWDWTPRKTPASSASNLLKGKQTATQNAGPKGNIVALAWDPQGKHLAIGLSTSPEEPISSSLALLSVQTGLPALPPFALPSSAGRITCLAWHTLDHYSPDPLLSSSAISLIAKLPALPKVVKEPLGGAAPNAPGQGGTAGVGGIGGGPGGGMFGNAKMAMLQKEREKEAGRALDLSSSAPMFPSTIPEADVAELKVDDEEPKPSLLVIGDDKGNAHVYLDGTVLLGSVQVDPTSQIIGAATLSSSASASTPRIDLILSKGDSSSTKIFLGSTSLSLPPSLLAVTRHSTALRTAVAHAFEALQEARNAWDESRRIGKGWLTRLADLSKAQATTHTPISQLLLLMMTGRSSVPLHDFLASKMNERVLSRWESTTAAALEKLRTTAFMSVVPALEHVVLLLEELQSWSSWTKKFGAFDLDSNFLAAIIEVALEALRAATRLEKVALEEERCFSAFSHWLRYELEKVALADGSDIRPMARFQPIPVAHYIRNCLSVESSTITPLVNLGPALSPLDGNADIKEAEVWFEALSDAKERSARKEAAFLFGDSRQETLAGMMRRMKEELKGQADAAIVAGQAGTRSGSAAQEKERPDRADGTSTTSKAPVSLPILLHLLASRLGTGLDKAVRKVGEQAIVERFNHIDLGHAGPDGSYTRHRVLKNLTHFFAWIYCEQLHIASKDSSSFSVQFSRFALNDQSGAKYDVVDFDFYDDEELVLVIKELGDSGALRYKLATVSLSNLQGSSSSSTVGPSILPLSRYHILDPHYPPQSLALNGNEGRRFACVLAGEGRRLQVIELDIEEDEEGIGSTAGAEEDITMEE